MVEGELTIGPGQRYAGAQGGSASEQGAVLEVPEVGRLHHRYEQQAA